VTADRTGVVVSGTGGVWQVLTDSGQVDVSMRGRLKKSNAGRRADGSLRRDTIAARAVTTKLAVGDHVRLEQGEGSAGGAEDWAIAEILPRRSSLRRREPGGGMGERVIAANVDQSIIVFAAANPEPHPRMLDRFLVIGEANGIALRIIINKVELVGEPAARERFADYERAGYEVHFTSVKQRIGIDVLGAALAGKVSVLSGPSGVGKSSLLNTLFPGLGLRVAEISESVNKGRHTTVGAFMHPLPVPPGGAVVDTPGLREIGMWALPRSELDTCFPEFREPREGCRFNNCSHIAEPGCAVRHGVESKDISAARYDSYCKLREEINAEETKRPGPPSKRR
jgi:ribosome biogenesis GTPase / thiamine phosphate phosphatase